MVMQMPSWRHTAAEGLWRVGGALQYVKGLAREEQLAHDELKYREWQKDMKEFNLLINATSNMKPQQRANVFTTYAQKHTESGNQSMADIMGMLVQADEEDMVTAKQMSTEMAEMLEDPSRDKLIQFEAKYPDTPTSLINRAWDDLRIERDEKKDVARIERERKGKIVELKKEGWVDIGRDAKFEDLDDPTGRIVEAYGKRWYVPGKKKELSFEEKERIKAKYKVAKEPTLVTWTTATKELKGRFGKQDPIGNIIITPELAGMHRIAQKQLVVLKNQKLKPLDAINKSEDFARNVETRYWQYIDAAGKDRDLQEKVKKAFRSKYNYVPKRKPIR